LATVDLGHGLPVQIVFGGKYRVRPGELVPVAPPGALVMAVPPGGLAVSRTKKMRCRRYRGERSHGMLCSLAELGWVVGGRDEVAILRDVSPGDRLDDLPAERQAKIMTTQPITVVDVVPQDNRAVTHEIDRTAAKD
jgi:tRNA-binding EMAP/Myf-like protein